MLQECLMNIVFAFKPDSETAELMQPTHGAFYNPIDSILVLQRNERV
jgi:hypothetical protein